MVGKFNVIKVDISELLHTVCEHEIRYYQQALLSLQGNLSWPSKLMLPVDEKNKTYQRRIKLVQLWSNRTTGNHSDQETQQASLPSVSDD